MRSFNVFGMLSTLEQRKPRWPRINARLLRKRIHGAKVASNEEATGHGINFASFAEIFDVFAKFFDVFA